MARALYQIDKVSGRTRITEIPPGAGDEAQKKFYSDVVAAMGAAIRKCVA